MLKSSTHLFDWLSGLPSFVAVALIVALLCGFFWGESGVFISMLVTVPLGLMLTLAGAWKNR